MGQGASGAVPADRDAGKKAVDRAGLSDSQYRSLRANLGLADGEDTPEAHVELTVFLERFPLHLRPLVQPLFFHLSAARVGDAVASWPKLVQGLARATVAGGDGLTWQELLEAWGAAEAATPGADASLCVELASLLCFWCAHPDLRPSPADAAETGPETARMVGALQALQRTVSEGDAMAKPLAGAAPLLPRAVGPRLAHALFGAVAPPEVPVLESRILDDRGLSFLLRGSNPALWWSDAWTPLYRDWRDGRSFNALLQGVLHYGGHAALVIKTSGGEVFGAVSNYWEETNNKFGGNTECFLFALQPVMQTLHSSGKAGNHVYLNSVNKHAPRGLGFGGRLDFCRLWLDADFEACHVLKSDATYTDGALMPNPEDNYHIGFKVSILEVWGCEGEEARARQAEQQNIRQRNREQARKVDRAQFLENDFDKEMFFGKTFKGTEDAREETGVVSKRNET